MREYWEEKEEGWIAGNRRRGEEGGAARKGDKEGEKEGDAAAFDVIDVEAKETEG